mmetsp:Transcript_67349/g.206264  ORF Transcript_67349/g.206264 Transcript_67349/m.206264 type:complete len:243 (+) Transcript_67349:276-1004(+)
MGRNPGVLTGPSKRSTFDRRLPHGPAGPRERDPDALGEEARLELVSHVRVHDGAVPVALHVRLQSLVAVAPSNLANLVGPHPPLRVRAEATLEPRHQRRVDQVHERIPEPASSGEVNRQVHEIIAPSEALVVEQPHEHVARVVVGQVPHHERRAAILAFRPRLQGDGGGGAALHPAGRSLGTDQSTAFARLVFLNFLAADRRRCGWRAWLVRDDGAAGAPRAQHRIRPRAGHPAGLLVLDIN